MNEEAVQPPTHRERVLLNHVVRLREQNRELAEAVAIERRLRKAAWRTYQDWCSRKVSSFLQYLTFTATGSERAGQWMENAFRKDTERNFFRKGLW